jgi:hypothetical protein
MVQTDFKTIGIDTMDDLLKARKLFEWSKLEDSFFIKFLIGKLLETLIFLKSVL